ncbi:MAG: hypothetical protein P8M30_08455 [Planctomycetaceae bacterium]|nr:hypothetical protein [Planctomycetaceae bacterium]
MIVNLILRFARENTTWGCDRIQGALANVGFHISDTTVENVLKNHGIEPAPNRQKSQSWSTFLKAHWETLFATDFTTVEVWTPRGDRRGDHQPTYNMDAADLSRVDQ